MAANKNEAGAKFACLAARHAALDTEGLGLIGRRENHAAADRDRLAAQARIQKLLDRSVEGVEIRVENGGDRFHGTKTEQNESIVKPRTGTDMSQVGR